MSEDEEDEEIETNQRGTLFSKSDEKIADAVMEWSKGNEVNLLCPIDTLKTSFESPKSKTLFFQYLANKNEEMKGSLNSIFSKNWGAWNDSWLPHLKSAKCTILENKYWNDFVLILNLGPNIFMAKVSKKALITK